MMSHPYNKSHKPLVERRRRERINRSLEELKLLVLSNQARDDSDYSRMEKTDILEMTARFLRSSQISEPSNVDVSKYSRGFQECAALVLSHLSSSSDIPQALRLQLLQHLTSHLQRAPNFTRHPAGTTQSYFRFLQPLRIQVPEWGSPESWCNTPGSHLTSRHLDTKGHESKEADCNSSPVEGHPKATQSAQTAADGRSSNVVERTGVLSISRSGPRSGGGSVSDKGNKKVGDRGGQVSDEHTDPSFVESRHVWRPF